MKGLLVVVVALCIAAPAAAQTPEWHPRLIHAAIGASITTHFADIATTEYGLGTGRLREANPLMRWATDRGPLPAAAAKSLLALGSNYGLYRLHQAHPKWALVLSGVSTATISYVAYRNHQLTGK